MRKHKNKIIAILATLCLLLGCTSSKKNQPTPHYSSALPGNIQLKENKLQFVNHKTLGSLGKKWHKNQVISIAHFGDSHIQPGWQVALLRDKFQALKGDAGRGMIFPYAIAKTYSQEDYSSSFSGKWLSANSIHNPPKIALGVSGFVAKTSEKQAEVKFTFKKALSLSTTKGTLFFKTSDGAYQLTLTSGGFSQKIVSKPSHTTQIAEFILPKISTDLTLTIESQVPDASFEFHGISLTKPNNTGVIYHNLGVGGASYKALLQQKLFGEQFKQLNADLVILDWGTNDLIYTNQIDENLENTIRSTIRKVRSLNPNAAILLTSVQEAHYKGRHISVAKAYSKLIREIAQSENTLFYDWYQISGANHSVALWKQQGFASKDGIHLNAKGYRVRAKLLADAIIYALQNQ